jgi:hypothetical protein
MSDDLDRHHREHDRLAAVVASTKTSITDGELPAAVPLGDECAGDSRQHVVDRHAACVAFHYDIHSRIPAITARGDHDPWIGLEVRELLFTNAGGEPETAKRPSDDAMRYIESQDGTPQSVARRSE